MKNVVFTTLMTILSLGQIFAQNPLMDKKGKASFFSEAPLENIEAVNNDVFGAIDLENGTLAVSMFIKNFHFDNSLMEEHFNENYLESDKYPKAKFKGKINDFTIVDFKKTGSHEVDVEGEIEIHGVTKPLRTKIRIDITPSNIKVATSFVLAVADFGIKVPRLVIKNIAEEVEVKSMFNFSRQ